MDTYQVPDLREILTRLRELYELSIEAAQFATRINRPVLKSLLYSNQGVGKRTLGLLYGWWFNRRHHDQRLLNVIWANSTDLRRDWNRLQYAMRELYPEDYEHE